MFAVACEKARQFTRSVILSHRRFDGQCGTDIGAFVVINREGWIVTAWHILKTVEDLVAACERHKAYVTERQAIEDDPDLTFKQKKKKRSQLRHPAPDAPQDCSVWWGHDGWEIREFAGIPQADLAVARLEPFDPSKISITGYPTFKDPAKGLPAGTSLCKHGFPFHNIEPTFDPVKGAFELPPGAVPPPLFAIEGILSRTVHVGGIKNPPAYPVTFLETSSPGLKGQSGGPITDSRGTVWAIQSQTRHYPLGFSPSVPNGRPNEKEHQFLNVGWGIHAETLVGLFRERGIDFQLSDY